MYRLLEHTIRYLHDIHKIIIVHRVRVGRARVDMIFEIETTRTIDLLEALGAQKSKVYVALTFAGDYNRGVLNRFQRKVGELYKDHVDPKNVFVSHYVLISELREEAHQHSIERLQKTHQKILQQVLEAVEPFRPVQE